MKHVMDMTMAELQRNSGYLRRRSKEWNAAWRGLLERTGDTEYGDWSYWGSDHFTGRWAHFFRHQHHPRQRGGIWSLRIDASPGWTPRSEEAPKRRKVH